MTEGSLTDAAVDSTMRTIKPVPTSIAEYIARYSPDVQAILQQIRQVVCRAAPEAQEVISYQMPALKQRRVLVYYAAFKKHIGFYPPVRGDAELETACAPYAGEKGNLRFPLDRPIPYDLIERLTRFRLEQDLATPLRARKK